MTTLEQKTLNAMKERFSLEIMTSGNERIMNVLIHLDDLKFLIINKVYNHPSTAYSLRSWLARAGYIVINEDKKIAIVDIDKLRELKE